MSEVLEIFALALLAACYPTLLVAVTVMLFLPSPKRLMLGYLLGAYTMGIGLGLVIYAPHWLNHRREKQRLEEEAAGESDRASTLARSLPAD